MSTDGIVTGTGIAPSTRIDIDDYSTKPEYDIQWRYFLRALLELQRAPPEDPNGYYRIAGIHGWPMVTWPDLKAESGKVGYCSHGNTRFLTWHRVYTLLLEERLVKIAVKLAEQAPENLRADYTAKAKEIRIPYWDFGCKPDLPKSMVKRDVAIIIPEIHLENPTTIHNPLYSYRSTGASKEPDFINETHRFSDTEANLRLTRANLRNLVYHALNTEQPYNKFSNTGGGNTSIEQPHNNVHNAISPIMQQASVTGFDPIFWITHVTIDYYYALWQARYPEKLYTDNVSGTNTLNHKLRPFKRDATNLWTSKNIQRSSDRNPTTYELGYQYPETLETHGETKRKEEATKAIKDRYGPEEDEEDGGGGGVRVYPPGAIDRSNISLPGNITFPDEMTFRREWRLVIEVKKNLVPSNFGIFFFFGSPSDNAWEWDTHPNTVASFHTFKANIETCSNCQDQEEATMYGSIHLTDTMYKLLPDNIHLDDPKGDALVKWLLDNIGWGIRKLDGTRYRVSNENAKDLVLKLESHMEAYAPIDENLIPADSDYSNLLGYTFDSKDMGISYLDFQK